MERHIELSLLVRSASCHGTCLNSVGHNDCDDTLVVGNTDSILDSGMDTHVERHLGVAIYVVSFFGECWDDFESNVCSLCACPDE